MEVGRKNEILIAADFSEKRMLPLGKSGFGQLLAGVERCLEMTTRPRSEEDLRRWLQGGIEDYEALIDYYRSIPFDEMDEVDEDFRYLFEYRDKLEGLRVHIDAFVARARGNEPKVSKEWDEYVQTTSVITELWEMMHRYRGEILAKTVEGE